MAQLDTVKLWKQAAATSLLIREEGSRFTKSDCQLCLAAMLLAARLSKENKHLDKAAFLAQCENIWNSKLTDLSDAEFQLFVTEGT